MNPLDGRIAIVTGASAGIGRATALACARAGARVIVNARREERLNELIGQIERDRGTDRALAIAGDAADPETIERMLAAAWNSFEAEADLVVVNAGRGLAGSLLTSDDREWEEMIRTNYVGAARLMRAAASRMNQDLEQGTDWQQGAHDIVVIGSNVGRHVSPFSSMYGSTKFAVHSLAEALRREVGPQGIRVSLIEPGVVATEFQEIAGYSDDLVGTLTERFGPVLTPEDVAQTIVFTASMPPPVHVSDMLIRPTRQEYP